jgi:hypothetical protein
MPKFQIFGFKFSSLRIMHWCELDCGLLLLAEEPVVGQFSRSFKSVMPCPSHVSEAVF